MLEHNIERLTTLQLAKKISILMQNKLSLPGTGTKVYFFKEKKLKRQIIVCGYKGKHPLLQYFAVNYYFPNLQGNI